VTAPTQDNLDNDDLGFEVIDLTGPPAGVPSDNTTMSAIIEEFERHGYESDMVPLEGGRVRCVHCRSVVDARDLRVVAIRRLEGASDPDDMSMIIAVDCPICEEGATLVFNYGPSMGEAEQDVLMALQPKQRHGR
jgi:hypothetical protein